MGELAVKLTDTEFSVPAEFCKTRGFDKIARPNFRKLAVKTRVMTTLRTTLLLFVN
jgi:hypothetical protein